MSIYCIGDIHGKFDRLEQAVSDLDSNSHIICVGDIGIGFADSLTTACLDPLQAIAADKNCMIWMLRGNHDDPAIWRQHQLEWNSSLPNIFLLDDIAHLHLDGVPVITVGGAISIDRSAEHRVDGETWWKEEQILPDAAHRVKQLVDANGPCELLITHAGPITALPIFNAEEDSIAHYTQQDEHLVNDIEIERTILAHCVHYSEAKKVIYGHYHVSLSNHNTGVDYQCLAELEVHKYDQSANQVAAAS